MKLWVDVVRFMKRGAAGGALGFFTYAELSQSLHNLVACRAYSFRIAIWVIMFHFLRLDRLRWFFFILFGWGVHVKERSKEEGGIPMIKIQKEKVH
jgi:hypothetical protein